MNWKKELWLFVKTSLFFIIQLIFSTVAADFLSGVEAIFKLNELNSMWKFFWNITIIIFLFLMNYLIWKFLILKFLPIQKEEKEN